MISDSDKTVIDVTLEEYKQYRQELNDTIKRQDAMVTLTVTLCGVIFTIGYYFLDAGRSELYSFFMGLLGPSSICFAGSYWISLVFQQKRYTMYLRELEIALKNIEPRIKFCWELYSNSRHTYKAGDKSISFSTKSLLSQQVTLMAYILVPLFMFATAFIDKLAISFGECWQYITASGLLRAAAGGFSVIYLAFSAVVVFYIRKIVQIYSYTENLEPANRVYTYTMQSL